MYCRIFRQIAITPFFIYEPYPLQFFSLLLLSTQVITLSSLLDTITIISLSARKYIIPFSHSVLSPLGLIIDHDVHFDFSFDFLLSSSLIPSLTSLSSLILQPTARYALDQDPLYDSFIKPSDAGYSIAGDRPPGNSTRIVNSRAEFTTPSALTNSWIPNSPLHHPQL